MRYMVWLACLLPMAVAAAGPASEDWQEDLDVYAKELAARHIDPFHTLPETAFREAVARIRAESSTRSEIIVDLMRLTRRIGDGHTAMPLWNQAMSRFPFAVKLFDGVPYVIRAPKTQAHLLGAHLVSIGGVPAADVIDALAPIVPFVENAGSRRVRVAQNLPKAELLEGLGIIEAGAPVDFVFEKDGERIEEKLEAGEQDDAWASLSFRDAAMFERVVGVDDDTWAGTTADDRTVYVKFRRYPSMNDMANMAFALLDEIDARQSRELIIDLRENYGGDFFVGLKLAQALVLADSIDWKSGVYVLIDNETFSAAMSNAAQYRQVFNARLVGEPTGARPVGYQDMGQFELPNSGLLVTYSKRRYRFAEGEPDALHPDVPVTTSFADYRAGRDPVLEWVLEDIAARQ